MALGPQLCSLLPFVHALSGSDTTSRPYGVGKPAALKLLRTNAGFREAVQACMDSTSKADITENGEKCMIMLYDASWKHSINNLRLHKFVSKVASATSCVQVYSLPPTSDATVYHIFRVYLQTQIWIGNNTLNPCDWGWENVNGNLQPIKTVLQPAPEELLKVVRCSCRQDCGSMRCSCRKHGLDCSISCSECRGVGCTNSKLQSLSDSEDDCGDDES